MVSNKILAVAVSCCPCSSLRHQDDLLFWCLVLIALICVELTGCYLSPSRAVTGPRISGVAQLHEIGLAIIGYRDDYGALPKHFSDLVGSGVPLNRIGIFT